MLFRENPRLSNNHIVAVLVPHLADYGADHPLMVYVCTLEADVI